MCMYSKITFISKSQTFLYSEILSQPTPGYRRSFYIFRRSEKRLQIVSTENKFNKRIV